MSSLDEFVALEVPSVIFKDDCGYCFETMYNENESQGHHLDICLNCFQSFCGRHKSLHAKTALQELNAHHDRWLRVQKIKRPEVEGRSEKKLKLEVIEKSDEELYESRWWLLKGSDELTNWNSCQTTSDVAKKAKQILDARSSSFAQASQSWQLEVKPCAHVRDFQLPTKEAPPKSEQACEECDLASNLWLCLHCGKLGCGRQQVGIDGNSHALAHFQEHGSHPLAVKLGSLSNSSADIYCYSCDDEVKFDNFEQWATILSHWGIDLSNKTAQEKTLIEMQVEQNMNWDFQMVDSQGHELRHLPSSKIYGCGLLNLGNSCYMNSVLQAVFNGGLTGWSLDVLADFPHTVVYPSSNLQCQLIKLRNAMKYEPERYPNGIKPTSLKSTVGGSHEEFSSQRQQDAMEFLTFFVDQLDNKIFKSMKTNPNDRIRFSLEDRIQCTRCGGVKYTAQVSEFLQLPMFETEEPLQFEQLIEKHFESEIVEFRCPKCSELTTVEKCSRFETFPDTLIINPSRIKLENWIPIKTNQELIIPGLELEDGNYLEMSNYKASKKGRDREFLLPEDKDTGFRPKEDYVNQLLEMGFTKNAATRALFSTGNDSTEAAMNWLFQHIEDSDVNEPFIVPANAPEVDPNALESLLSMGLDRNVSRKALILNKGDINASVEWVFSHPDDDGVLENPREACVDVKSYGSPDASSAKYQLKAIVCHKGNSVQSGHYVAFIKKPIDGTESWVLYNDEKIVAASDTKNYEEMRKNGYIYFFSKAV
ncbi:LAMI_0C05534g1_1 [Lachancea mirantina]|uniref:Ubiquitin carboxyl-terminal hydrolase n=1 Tax=Lachancea mirantina TaxID=1230905 RepID=A0A1G4J2S1_9SACH|nr:LAMI_0C05534g1_1 [Lachancea mirantina]